LKSNIGTLVFILIGIFIIAFITGCDTTKYEIKTKVIPIYTVEDVEDCIVSLEYKLGPLLILDEVEVTPIQIRYILKNKVKSLDLKVKYADFDSASNGFYYYLGGCRFGEDETEPTDLKSLVDYSDKIPGFTWLVKESKEVKSISESSSSSKSDLKILK